MRDIQSYYRQQTFAIRQRFIPHFALQQAAIAMISHSVFTKALNDLSSYSTEAMVPPTKLRVLCLHGFLMNKSVMEHQTRDLRTILGSNAEFVYLNGPHEVAGDSYDMIEELYAGYKPFREWWKLPKALQKQRIHDVLATHASHDMTDLDPENEWYTIYEGIEHTMALLHQEIMTLGPFDIVVGFSQPTVLLTTLAMWYAKRQLQCPWKLSILVGGIRVHGKNVQSLLETEDGNELLVQTPSIHIIGKNDPLFEEGLKLSRMYERWGKHGSVKRLMLFHGCGQSFPTIKVAPNVYEGIQNTVRQLWPRFAFHPVALETPASYKRQHFKSSPVPTARL